MSEKSKFGLTLEYGPILKHAWWSPTLSEFQKGDAIYESHPDKAPIAVSYVTDTSEKPNVEVNDLQYVGLVGRFIQDTSERKAFYRYEDFYNGRIRECY